MINPSRSRLLCKTFPVKICTMPSQGKPTGNMKFPCFLVVVCHFTHAAKNPTRLCLIGFILYENPAKCATTCFHQEFKATGMPSSSLMAKIIYLVPQNVLKFTLKGLQNQIQCVANCIFTSWCQRFCNVVCLKTFFCLMSCDLAYEYSYLSSLLVAWDDSQRGRLCLNYNAILITLISV